MKMTPHSARTGASQASQEALLAEPLENLAGPEVVAVTHGHRLMLRTALAGMLINAAIGVVGVLTPLVHPGLSTIDLAIVVCSTLAICGAVILHFMSKASARQIAEQSILIEAFHGLLSPQLITNASGKLVVANRAFLAWIGSGSEARKGESAMLAHYRGDEESQKNIQRLADVARSQNQTAIAEVALERSAGMEWQRFMAKPLQGWPGYVMWRIEDVTQRRRIEDAVREEQGKLLDFLAQAPVGIFSVDENGHFVLVNRTLADWLGYAAEEMTGDATHLHDVLAEPPKDAAPYALARGVEGEWHADLVMKSRDGRLFPTAITQTIVRSPDGAGLRTRSIVRDLTPERAWQEALSLSEQRFHRLFAEAPIGIALADDQLHLAEANLVFSDLASVPFDRVAGSALADLIRREESSGILASLREVLAGSDLRKPLEVLLESGKNVQIFARRFTGQHMPKGGLLLHLIDVTEQKKLQTQFVQSQKMQAIGQLAGGIAHDFNNLLTAMIGFCDLLLQRHRSTDPSFQDIDQIRQNANRAATLVRQLLAFSRQQTLQPTVLNLTDVLAELTNLLRRLIGVSITLKVVHGRDVGLVKVDVSQLEQVIVNLVVNARDAMPHGGALTITTSNHQQVHAEIRGQDEMPPGDYVLVEVADTGTGIPSAILQRIWEPFFSTKEIGAGTGLGLSTVYGIVRQTGGFVGVESLPGQGAKFQIFLPRYLPDATGEVIPAHAVSMQEKPGDLTGQGSILLVEDEDAVRMFSSRALSNKGYKVLEARSGDEALKILKESPAPDLVITDVVMPHMDGPTLVIEIRKILPQMKVIFISGYTEDRLQDQLQSSAPTYFLGKPFTLKQLAERVKDVLARK